MRKRLLMASIVLVGGSFALGRSFRPEPSTANPYPLLAKRILVENPNDSIVNFASLRKDIEKYMSDNNLKGSIYFEYLPTGTSIRVTGDDELVAASLMKIPVVMDLYKAAELGKVDLDSLVTLKNEWLDSRYGTLYQKGAGYSLTYREAARLTMTDSDNTAYAAILYSTQGLVPINENSIAASDVSFSRDNEKEIVISARAYTSFLKCLYFGCFLNYDHSQEILGFLSQSIYTERLRAGVPDPILVAHKIGTFSDKTQSDCGIVYLEKRNYALCVMLNDTEQNGDGHIQAISKQTYDFVSGIPQQ